MNALRFIWNLLPIKDWLYICAILALLAGFWWFVAHERGIGEAKCEARVAAAAAAAQADHNAMQAELDKLAGEDEKLKATKIPVLDFGCHLTPAQIKTLQKAMQ